MQGELQSKSGVNKIVNEHLRLKFDAAGRRNHNFEGYFTLQILVQKMYQHALNVYYRQIMLQVHYL